MLEKGADGDAECDTTHRGVSELFGFSRAMGGKSDSLLRGHFDQFIERSMSKMGGHRVTTITVNGKEVSAEHFRDRFKD